MFERIGSWCFHNRRVVVGCWVALVAGIVLLTSVIGSSFEVRPSVPDSEAVRGFDVLADNFDDLGASTTGTIVFRADQGVDTPNVVGLMETMFGQVRTFERVAYVQSPYDPMNPGQIAPAGDIAFAVIGLEGAYAPGNGGELGSEIARAAPQIAGLQVEVGGESLAEFEPPESELIGIAFAVFVLIAAFGSVMAMGLPIGVAVAGVGTGLGVMTLQSHLFELPDFALTLGAMIGLGVGIDYALFIVTRYREALDRGKDPHAATVEAMDSAGRAVVFAGATVVVSLLGMYLIGLPFMSGLGTAAATTVLLTMAAAVTLLPALLGFVQRRVEITRARGFVAAVLVAVGFFGAGLSQTPLLLAFPMALVVLVVGARVPTLNQVLEAPERKPMRDTNWYKWSRAIQRRPWLAAGTGAGILILLSLPVLSLHLGVADEGNLPEETTTRQAYDLLTEGFGPGFNGPVIAAIEIGPGGGIADVEAVAAALAADEGVVGVSPPILSSSGGAAFLQAIPATAPQERTTDRLVDRLRDNTFPEITANRDVTVHVTGPVALNRDFTSYLSSRMTRFFVAVLGLSFLLLAMVFRSVLVPLKAVIMNMLSIGGAYGLLVIVFQWGWFSWAGLGEGAPIEPFLPIMLFAVVFGLSMDYEVFLLSRIKEEYDRTGDAVNSVADGLALTARVITAAAAIMVFVFGSFMLEDNRVVQSFGFGLAAAVLLDATLVRMLLVPATMELLGEKNWWLPDWLDRILPRLDVEGGKYSSEVSDRQ